jgi:GT2 family glycosyltransferase
LNAAAGLVIEDDCDAVVVINADDYMRADAVELLVRAIEGHDWSVSYGRQVGETNALQVPLKPFPLSLADFSGPHCPIGVFALVRSAVWQDLAGFATDISLPNSYGYNEDWDFWIRALKAGHGAGALVREPLLHYVMSDKQLHKQGLSRHAEARARIMAKHPDVFQNRQWAPCPCGCA